MLPPPNNPSWPRGSLLSYQCELWDAAVKGLAPPPPPHTHTYTGHPGGSDPRHVPFTDTQQVLGKPAASTPARPLAKLFEHVLTL